MSSQRDADHAPLCLDCAHHQQEASGVPGRSRHLCMAKISVVTGESVGEHCVLERGARLGSCKPEGLLFRSKAVRNMLNGIDKTIHEVGQ
jgi:hypothetical protein